MKNAIIYMPHDKLSELRDMLHDNKKIEAIKTVRKFGRFKQVVSDDALLGPKRIILRPNLRDATHAVNRYIRDVLGNKSPAKLTITSNESLDDAHIIKPNGYISSINFDMPEGELQFTNVQDMQLHILSHMKKMSVSDVQRMLGLIQVLKEYENDI